MPKIPLDSDVRGNLARTLQNLLDNGLSQKGELPERWRKNEEIYDNAPPSNTDKSKIVRIHEPFSQPRQDALSASVCGVITKQDPYMIARDLSNGDRSSRLEQAIQFFWQRMPANFEIMCRRASTVATNTNKAVWKLSWVPPDDSKQFGLKMEIVHPENYVCSPAIKDNLANAKLVGNRFYKRRREIDDWKNAKIYYQDNEGSIPAANLTSNDPVGAVDRSLSKPGLSTNDKEDDLIELWDLVVRLDISAVKNQQTPEPKDAKPEQLYRVVLAVSSPEVLLVEKYPYSRPMYFEAGFIEDPLVYWSGKSVAFNLQGLQQEFDLLSSAMYNAVMAEAMPLVIGSGLPDKYNQYGWGDVLSLDEAMIAPPWSPPAKFSGGQSLMAKMQATERIGDQVARISQNSMGSIASGNRTATEQSVIAAGVANGQEEYIANFSACFPDMAAATCEIILLNWDDWEVFRLQPIMQPPQMDPMGAPMPPQPALDPATGQPMATGFLDIQQEDLTIQVVWEPTGKTPGHAPQAKIQAAQLLFSVGAQIPQAGANMYNLFKVLCTSSGLNADNVQYTPQELQQQQQQQMQAQQQQQATAQAQSQAADSQTQAHEAQASATNAHAEHAQGAQSNLIQMINTMEAKEQAQRALGGS